jgi:hypothetical protein
VPVDAATALEDGRYPVLEKATTTLEDAGTASVNVPFGFVAVVADADATVTPESTAPVASVTTPLIVAIDASGVTEASAVVDASGGLEPSGVIPVSGIIDPSLVIDPSGISVASIPPSGAPPLDDPLLLLHATMTTADPRASVRNLISPAHSKTRARGAIPESMASLLRATPDDPPPSTAPPEAPRRRLR